MVGLSDSSVDEVYMRPDGILVCVYRGAHHLEDALRLNAVVRKLTGGVRYPILADLRELAFASMEARQFHKEEGEKLALGSAILVASTVTRMIGSIFIAVNRPSIPTRLFENEAEAVQWLLELQRRAGKVPSDAPRLPPSQPKIQPRRISRETDDLLEVISSYMARQYDVQVRRRGKDAKEDALASAINLLGEELYHSTLSKDRFLQIINASSAIFYTRDVHGGSVTFMGSNVEQLGYVPDQFVSDQNFWAERIHEEDRESVREALASLIQFGRESLELTYRFKRADGRAIWTRDRMKVIRSESGVPSEVIGFWRDIDAEANASHMANLLHDVLDRTAIVAKTDRAGKIVSVNDNFCKISGYSREELIGKDHRLVNSGFHSHEFFQVLWKRISSGNIWRGEIKNRRKDGSHYWVDSTIAPIFNRRNQIEGYIALRVDVTARKVAEEGLVASSKMASLGEMAAGIAHEVNNPLTVVHGKAAQMIRMIEAGKATPEAIRQSFETIVETTERIAKIIKGLRAFSRNAEDDPFHQVGLREVVNDALNLCSQRFKVYGVRIDVDEVPQVEIKCRSVQISQVLLNLLNNAFDAVEALDEKWVRLRFETDVSRVRILVTDSGRGIPPHVASKMMHPFFTTKELGKGTGIGLSLSRGIVETHGGKLLYDQASPNTCFVVELPLRQKHNQEDAA